MHPNITMFPSPFLSLIYTYLIKNVGNNFKESGTGVVVVVIAHRDEVVQTGLDVRAQKIAERLNGVFGELRGRVSLQLRKN